MTLALPAAAETLDAQQVQTLMIGKRIDWVTPDGNTKGFSKYNSNGTGSVSITAPNKLKDKGTWRIVGNKFCSTWKAIRDGAEGCSTIRTTKQDGVYRLDNVFIKPK